MTIEDDQKAAKAMIKAVYDDGEAEINGRVYTFLKMTHKKRRTVFAFMSRVQHMLSVQDFSFIDWPEFEPVEKIIHDYVTFNGDSLGKLPNHWDEHPEDYINFTLTALPVISYPFMGASLTA